MASDNETFEKLEVWCRSHALSIELYRLLAECRDWGFKDLITRAGLEANIATLGKSAYGAYLRRLLA